MSSPSVQSKDPANLSIRRWRLSTVVRMSKKLLGGVCLCIWKLLAAPLCKVGNRIISRYRKVADAEAAIHALKAQLVAQHGSFEQERKTYKDREAILQQQLDEYKSKFLELERKRPFLEKLAIVGAAVRCRALEHAKGRRIFGEGKDKFTNIRGEVDMEVIKKGNVACHRGNIKADYSLYQLGYKHLQSFNQIYKPRCPLFFLVSGVSKYGDPCDECAYQFGIA
ncbi:hypothetical protein BELL_0120g00190 [Botrytis elliptica]|uniref:Uncharacterized protein n=1 Tax=Botrytis elliptica TaxID=278938 RepID=A0A4Z1JUL9_9HELO|nr:hypothetical protein BELL_0120g00190 [Botrytis elliptica]